MDDSTYLGAVLSNLRDLVDSESDHWSTCLSAVLEHHPHCSDHNSSEVQIAHVHPPGSYPSRRFSFDWNYSCERTLMSCFLINEPLQLLAWTTLTYVEQWHGHLSIEICHSKETEVCWKEKNQSSRSLRRVLTCSSISFCISEIWVVKKEEENDFG